MPISRFICLVCFAGWLAAAPAVLAQESGFDLIVAIRDASDAPLNGIDVRLQSDAEAPPLARAATDARGQAQFRALPHERVRVLVAGVLPTGARLRQPGQDARGILVVLGSTRTQLDLRVDADGLVLPDPATMIATLPNGPLVASPAPEHRQAIRPTPVPAFPTQPDVLARMPGSAAPSVGAGGGESVLSWLVWTSVTLILIGAAIVYARSRAGRRA